MCVSRSKNAKVEKSRGDFGENNDWQRGRHQINERQIDTHTILLEYLLGCIFLMKYGNVIVISFFCGYLKR